MSNGVIRASMRLRTMRDTTSRVVHDRQRNTWHPDCSPDCSSEARDPEGRGSPGLAKRTEPVPMRDAMDKARARER
jgi:hypothetical protein